MHTRPNFNFIAPVYDGLARLVFGRRLQQAQTAGLPWVPTGATVLLLGGGTGESLVALLKTCQPARVVYLESSAAMLARASRRLLTAPVAATVEFRLGTEAALKPDEVFDLVMTPFVLDLFTEQTLQHHLIPALGRVLRPGGLWLITDFVPGHSGWRQALIGTMIGFFRLTAGIETRQLANWPAQLKQAGFVRHQELSQLDGLVATELWQRPTGH